jgi:3-oxoacyl-(acyl-carrier-protein) synthase
MTLSLLRFFQPVLTRCFAAQVDVALSNSFGFGGHNSCILFSAFKE